MEIVGMIVLFIAILIAGIHRQWLTFIGCSLVIMSIIVLLSQFYKADPIVTETTIITNHVNIYGNEYFFTRPVRISHVTSKRPYLLFDKNEKWVVDIDYEKKSGN